MNMRLLSTLLAAAAALLLSLPAAAADEAAGAVLPPPAANPFPDPSHTHSLDELIELIPPDMLADLHAADFITVRDLKADLPHGTLVIKKGVIASFKHPERRTAGVVIGECELRMDKLPSGADAYNVFMDGWSGQPGDPIIVRKSFLSASPNGGAQLRDVGFVAALRKWDTLKPAEQQAFTEILARAWGASWCDNAASLEQKCFVPRDPQGGEVFGAVWVEGYQDADADGLLRIDFRVEADGQTTRAAEHDSGKLLMQYPIAPGTTPAE